MGDLSGGAASGSCFELYNVSVSVVPFLLGPVPAVCKESSLFWLPGTIPDAKHSIPPTCNSRYFKVSFLLWNQGFSWSISSCRQEWGKGWVFWHTHCSWEPWPVNFFKIIMFLGHQASSINATMVVCLLDTRCWISVLGMQGDQLSTLLKAVCLFVFYPVSCSDLVLLIMNCWQRTGIPWVKSQNKALHSYHLYYPGFLLILI